MKGTPTPPPPRAAQPLLPPAQAFVVQFSSDSDPPQRRFAGRVEHVLSGRARPFRSANELFDCVASMLADVKAAADTDG